MTPAIRARRLPAREPLLRLCNALSPGSRLVRLRRLGGGLDAEMHAVRLREPSGGERAFVVRRYPEHLLTGDLELPRRAWLTLGALERLGINAPRPLWFDGEGALCGAPTIVMSLLPGRGELRPTNLATWTVGLATGLASVHRAPIAAEDLRFLPAPGHEIDSVLNVSAGRRTRIEAQETGPAVLHALETWRSRLRPASPSLLHSDYWAGNTLWLRGRLSGIVDWDYAAVGYPGADVGYCRVDLAMLIGPEAPDLFLEAYEAAAGRRVPQLFFWDLVGALRALPDPERWLPGYHELGRGDMTGELMQARLRAFIQSALTRAGLR